MEALEDCIPEAGEEVPTSPTDQNFEEEAHQDEEGQSDEEEEGLIDIAILSIKSTRRKKRLPALPDSVRFHPIPSSFSVYVLNSPLFSPVRSLFLSRGFSPNGEELSGYSSSFLVAF